VFLLKLLSHAGHRRLELGLALERACVSVGQAGKGMRQRVRHTVVSTSAPSHSRPLVCGVAYTHTHTHTHTHLGGLAAGGLAGGVAIGNLAPHLGHGLLSLLAPALYLPVLRLP